MRFYKAFFLSSLLAFNTAIATADEQAPKVPRFSIENMDKTVPPSVDFYQYANGNWIKKNPVPNDKAIWTSFSEIDARNEYLLHGILENARNDKTAKAHTPSRLVGDFYTSAMDIERLEQLGLTPLNQDFAIVNAMNSVKDMFAILAQLHKIGVNALFDSGVQPDAKDSSIYAFQLEQGGLTLPDRDYYLQADFQKQRVAYLKHIEKMFQLAGETANANHNAHIVMNIETELAKASRSRVDLRDPIKNYNKKTTAEILTNYPCIPWQTYFDHLGVPTLSYAIIGQPEFFVAIEKLFHTYTLEEWKVYLRWHILHTAAPFLNQSIEEENFNFFGKVLKGQEQQEERWKRAKSVIDNAIGEALGQLYVEKYFPQEAKIRMNELVNNLRAVFKDHLQKLDWMSEITREKALAKFERFTQKIGYPEKFRDYSFLEIKADDYFGNVRRASLFESQRQIARVGKTVDKSEWQMTPPTVNAYFDPTLNEIVFPAGILQPPYFDTSMDDPINYGGIAVVIGHEITHGYDDEGRHFNADGILSDWWTEKDAQEFTKRAQKIVDEYNTFEMLPGVFVNGELTLGENIADLGGISIAYDAMERALQKDPSKRKIIDGLTPEQRFFLAYAQLWHTNVREAEARRRITIDPHAPGKFRSFGPLLNYQEFYDAFGIKPGTPMWRAPELRAKIW